MRLPLRLIALLALAAFVLAAPVVADAKPAKGKAKCALKKKAKCKKAKLKGVKVGKQNLTGANLAGATITGATFTGTNLSGVDLSRATLRDVTFKRVTLSGATLAKARLYDVRFENVRVSHLSTRADLFCFDALDTGIFKIAALCDSTGANFSGILFDHVIFTFATFTTVDFSNSTFRSTGFLEGSVVTSDFSGSRFADSVFQNTRLDGSLFDETRDVYVYAETNKSIADLVSGTSFFRATGMTFKPALPASASVRGLTGGAAVTVQRGTGSPAFTSITMYTDVSGGVYRISTSCDGTGAAAASGTCRGVYAKGDAMTVQIVAPTKLTLSGGGWTCTGPTGTAAPYTSTCTGSLTADVTLTYQAPAETAPVVQKSVTVTVDDTMGMNIPTIESITIATVAGGTATTVKSCPSASSCSALIDVGSTVRISASDSTHTVEMMCPGSSEWLPGSSLLTPPSVFTCPDFTLSADATAKVAGS